MRTRACKWPLTKRKCKKPALKGKRYCKFHQNLVETKTEPDDHYTYSDGWLD